MHTAGKIFLGLGVLMLIGGGIMAGMGGNALEDEVEGLEDLANLLLRTVPQEPSMWPIKMVGET